MLYDYLFIYIYIYICIFFYTYTYTYTHMYVYIYIYIGLEASYRDFMGGVLVSGFCCSASGVWSRVES